MLLTTSRISTEAARSGDEVACLSTDIFLDFFTFALDGTRVARAYGDDYLRILDLTTGGRASTTLGTGQRTDGTLTFRFDYPDDPFRTTFERHSAGKWYVRMRSQSDAGTWEPFADYTMMRPTEL
jgi:hypothetical protein